MTVTSFMTENFQFLKEIINKQILEQNFDSHRFIRCFAKNYEIEYVFLLSKYQNKPFWNVHMQIANFLSKNAGDLNIKKSGKVQSANIFGNIVENENWIKVN